MNLSSILKTVGKDLSHVASWIEDGLKIAAPVAQAVDPEIVPILAVAESILGKLQPAQLSAPVVQGTVTTLAALPASALQALIKAFAVSGAAPAS